MKSSYSLLVLLRTYMTTKITIDFSLSVQKLPIPVPIPTDVAEMQFKMKIIRQCEPYECLLGHAIAKCVSYQIYRYSTWTMNEP